MIKEVTHRNGSLIPSRREKKVQNIKWGLVHKNVKLLSGITADERCFAWKVTQDMLPVGSRIFRKNAERRCLANLSNDNTCQEVQDLKHAFKDCDQVVDGHNMIVQVLNRFTERNISYDLLVHLAFNHRRKPKLKCAIWFAVKCMYNLFIKKMFNKEQIIREMVKEIDWNLRLNRKVGSSAEMMKLKEILIEFNNVL